MLPTLTELRRMNAAQRICRIVDMSDDDLIEFTMQHSWDLADPWSSVLSCFCARLAISTGTRGSRRMHDGLSAACDPLSEAPQQLSATIEADEEYGFRVPMEAT